MTGQAKRHNLADWLAMHDLDQSLCRQILNAAAKQVSNAPADQEEPATQGYALDPDIAWLNVVDAMCAFFPAQRSIIESAFDNIPKVRVDHSNTSRRALTLDAGSPLHPTIIYTYLGNESDLLVMSHEFAHAMQIIASNGRFVTPIIREVCAFIGEIALLSRSSRSKDALYLKLVREWRNEDHKYLVSDRRKLDMDLSDMKTVYRYHWNYPIARYLAVRVSATYPPERMWMIFEGNLSVRQLVQEFENELS